MTEILRLPQKTDSWAVTRWVPGPNGGTYENPIYHTVFLAADRISVQESEKFSGVNRTSGKTYTRFKNHQKVVFSWKQGRLRVYEIAAKRGGGRIFRDVTSAPGWYSSLGGEALPYLLERAPFDIDLSTEALYELGQHRQVTKKDMANRVAQHIAYPALRGTTMGAVPYMAPHLRERDITAFARSAFKGNYRKDLVRWIARQRSIEPVYAAWTLQGIVPLEWIMEGMDGKYITPFTPKYLMERKNVTAGLKRFFADLPANQARNLILDNGDTGSMYIQDTVPELLDRPGGYIQRRVPEGYRFTTWQDAHDTLFPHNREHMDDYEYTPYVYENKEIPQTKIAQKLDNLTVDKYTIHSAKETDELRNWGDYMHNCIGSYSSNATEKRTNLFAVYEGEDLIANMEVSKDGEIRQLFGKYNKSLELAEGQKIFDAVGKKLGIKQQKYTEGWMF